MYSKSDYGGRKSMMINGASEHDKKTIERKLRSSSGREQFMNEYFANAEVGPKWYRNLAGVRTPSKQTEKSLFSRAFHC